MKSNFEFLSRYWPALAQIGAAAESYVYSDANACLYKLGMFGERLILEIFAFEHIKEPSIDNTHANRIRLLKREGLIPKKIDDILYALRKTRNDAVHAGADSVEDAKTLLSMTYNLAVWFMEVYGDWGYIAPAFVMPENVVQPDYESIIKEQEEKIAALSKQVEAVSTAASTKTSKERAEKGETASESMELSEAETRYLIDEQLRKFGWEVDTNTLRYSKGTRPQKGRNLAIAEWPTDSAVGKNGYADYALFVGLKLVGIVEAKKAAIDIPSVIDHQCKEYAKGIKGEHQEYIINQWGVYKVPFVFATNGRKYLKQIETKSGIWYLDLRSGANAPKALQGWISPQGLVEQLEKDIAAANAALQNTPFDLLRDPDGLNLRKYQINAIEAAEQAVIDGKQTVLLSMATGTGKTRTILGMIYRFIKSDRFKRVLFLVDRTALGEQAEDVFKEVKIEELMTLDSIYNIKGLDEKEIDRETKIHIATVQSLVKRILYPEGDTMPSVTDYDLIVVDEAHRGYILDKEMSETEMLYRNQDDYISKYRTVIEYFDAVKIALTATPALHTTEIFGKPVFNYSYREAVIDGYDNSLMELVRHTVEFIKRKPYGNKLLIKVKDEVKLVIDATSEYEPCDRQKIIEQNKKNTVRHAYFREYLALQRLCLLILQHQKHQIGAGARQIYGILFDGAWLWEEYVNSLIEDVFYHPMNKGGKGAQRLFDGNVGLIYPDFISRNSETRIIADAKYKPIDNIGNRDYLQVLAYMFRFDAKAGYYLYPEAEGSDDLKLWLNRGSTYEKNVMARDDISVTKHGLKIPVDALNYAEFSVRMKTCEQEFKSALIF